MKTVTITQWSAILLTVLSLSLGQIFFKRAANEMPDYEHAWASLTQGWLLIALVVYFIATALWVYTLRSVPLSVAYPFAALAYIAVPVLAHFMLGENLSARTLSGALIIVVGVYVSVS